MSPARLRLNASTVTAIAGARLPGRPRSTSATLHRAAEGLASKATVKQEAASLAASAQGDGIPVLDGCGLASSSPCLRRQIDAV